MKNTMNNNYVRKPKGEKARRASLTLAALALTLGGAFALTSCSGGNSPTIKTNGDNFVTVVTGGEVPETGELTIDKIDDKQVAYIGEGAYKGFTTLSKVTLSEGVLSLNKECFADCSSLTYLSIPSSVRYIASDAFKNDTSLIIETSLSYARWKELYKGSDVTDDRVKCGSYPVYLNGSFYTNVEYGKSFSVESNSPYGYKVSGYKVTERITKKSTTYNGATLKTTFSFHSDINVTPLYDASSYTVNLVTEEGDNIGTLTAKYREMMNRVTVPVKKGYSFLGYYLIEKSSNSDEITAKTQFFDKNGYATKVYPYTKSITLTALWDTDNPKKSTVMLEKNNGSASSTYTFTFGESYSIDAPSKKGYSFLYWDYDGSKVYTEGDKWEIDDEEVTLKAVYAPISCTVTLDFAGGTATDASAKKTITLTYDAKYTLPTVTSSGRTVTYWHGDDGLNYLTSDYWKGTTVSQLTARFTTL